MNAIELIAVRWLLHWAMLVDSVIGILTLGFVTPRLSIAVTLWIKKRNYDALTHHHR